MGVGIKNNNKTVQINSVDWWKKVLQNSCTRTPHLLPRQYSFVRTNMGLLFFEMRLNNRKNIFMKNLVQGRPVADIVVRVTGCKVKGTFRFAVTTYFWRATSSNTNWCRGGGVKNHFLNLFLHSDKLIIIRSPYFHPSLRTWKLNLPNPPTPGKTKWKFHAK